MYKRQVFDRAVNCGVLKAYSEAMDKIPKIIVPEDKKTVSYTHLDVYKRQVIRIIDCDEANAELRENLFNVAPAVDVVS